MRCFIQIVTISLCALVALPACAAKNLDPAVTKKLCNQIIKQIYADIERQKPNYPDLELYNLVAFKKNEWGYMLYQVPLFGCGGAVERWMSLAFRGRICTDRSRAGIQL